VDTQGLLLVACIHAADIPDRDGARLVAAAVGSRFPRLALIWADAGYRGKGIVGIQAVLTVRVDIVQHWWTGVRYVWVKEGQAPPEIPRGFHGLQWRWIVERTFAWFLTNRRLVVDYDELPSSSEVRLYLCMIRIMLRRLARSLS
jgi:putative transposase